MGLDVADVLTGIHPPFVSPFAYSSPTSPSPLAAAYAIPLSTRSPLASRAYLLLSLASSVLIVSAGLTDPEQRAYWARWADGIISVVGVSVSSLPVLLRTVEREEESPKTPDEEAELKVRADLTRARCWLMVADATTEALKDAAEAEKQVESDEIGKNRENADLIHECREAFGKG